MIEWHVRSRGALSITYSAMGLKEKEQSCHHDVWMYVAHAHPRGDRGAQYKARREGTLERESVAV